MYWYAAVGFLGDPMGRAVLAYAAGSLHVKGQGLGILVVKSK